jgi:hypothetical protein
MRAYALAELGGRLALHVFVEREDAFEALELAFREQPQWAESLFVAAIELNDQGTGQN